MDIIKLNETYRPAVDKYIKDEWGGPKLVSLGNMYDSSTLPGFIVVEEEKILGVILYKIDGDECEVAVLYSLAQGRGIGTNLLNEAVKKAKGCGCKRLWLVTTNDNTQAIRFYQKYGFSLKAVHIGSFEVVRQLKKGEPETGIDGIPIEHEFEFELML